MGSTAAFGCRVSSGGACSVPFCTIYAYFLVKHASSIHFSIQLVTIDTTNGRPLVDVVSVVFFMNVLNRHLGFHYRGRRGGLWLFTSEKTEGKSTRVPQGSPCPFIHKLGLHFYF